MKPEEKVPTLEQCQKLVELGVVMETEKRWCEVRWFHTLDKHDWVLTSENLMCRNYIPAPDVAELRELLPEWCLKEDFDFFDGQFWHLDLSYKTEAQARCAALIWLIENKYLKPEDIR